MPKAMKLGVNDSNFIAFNYFKDSLLIYNTTFA